MISADDRIDELCDAFEAEWLRGGQPHIADFIDRVAKSAQADLFYELLLVELEYRRNQDERPTEEEYLREFPQFAEPIQAANFRIVKKASATAAGAKDDTVRWSAHQPGSRIGHFELLERLGAGGMGEVWKVWDPRLKRPVAIKLPRIDATSEADLHRFVREGQAAAQLRHPHIASVHEVGHDGDTAYLVADYIEGESLRQFLRSHPMHHQATAELCAAVAEALHHAHEQGIVHRDLKPANIIIDRSGQPHVIDFGLAKWSSDERDLTVQGELLGTPAYMSPEQAGGDAAKIDRRTDVYSLGVILYEMLTGECPFTGECASVIHQILSREPAQPRTVDHRIPRDLDTICVKSLQKEPSRRYATTQEMAVDLRRFARGEPILARPVGPLEKSWRWLRRRPAVAAALVLAVVAISALTVAGTFVEENRELLGFQPVMITTHPAGAKVAFARLTALGELLPTEVNIPAGVTPLRHPAITRRLFCGSCLARRSISSGLSARAAFETIVGFVPSGLSPQSPL